MYPSLVNNTTIDWFHEWPADALQEVATRFLEDIKFPSRGLYTGVRLRVYVCPCGYFFSMCDVLHVSFSYYLRCVVRHLLLRM